MRARKWVVASLLILLISSGRAQQEQRFVLLPASEAKRAAEVYASTGPAQIKGSWQPAKADIDGLESNLPHIAELTPMGWTAKIRIQHPDQYYRQYLGVLVGGKRRIFVNAFCEVDDLSDWRERLVVVDDGATCFWHALYDPSSGTFSNLEINPRA